MNDIFEHMSSIAAQMDGPISSVYSAMAESVAPYLTDESLESICESPLLLEMAELAELAPGNFIKKSVRKDQRKNDQYKQQNADMYKGVPDKIAKWGHEAHGEGLRAFGMERSPKAPIAMKIQAHDDARQAHGVAAHHLSKAGHETAAAFHKRAQSYHANRKAALHADAVDGGAYAEDAQSDLQAASSYAKSASDRAQKLRDKIASASKMKAKGPAVEAPEGTFELDEGDYHPDVKNASMLAGNATKQAKMPHAGPEHHDAAARLHFIAHGVAQAHGHTDLAAKHMDMVSKHKAAGQELQKTA